MENKQVENEWMKPFQKCKHETWTIALRGIFKNQQMENGKLKIEKWVSQLVSSNPQTPPTPPINVCLRPIYGLFNRSPIK